MRVQVQTVKSVKVTKHPYYSEEGGWYFGTVTRAYKTTNGTVIVEEFWHVKEDWEAQ